MSKHHAMFATAPRGLEEMLADELQGLGLAQVRVRRGGAGFEADLAGAYRACLWSRVANRILLPLAEFEADDDDAPYAACGPSTGPITWARRTRWRSISPASRRP